MSPSPGWYGLLAATVRQAVLTQFRQDSCIASARVTLLVCHYFGIVAKPQAVKVCAYTPLAWEQRARLASLPAEQWPSGAWAVGITGGEHRPGRWNGHLVALAGRWLIDPSLDQLARPHLGLLVAASAWQMPEHWSGQVAEDEQGQITQPDGSVITYDALADTTWRQSPNWSAKAPGIRRCTALAIRHLTGAGQ